MKQTKVVLAHSLQTFIFALDALRQDGWEFDPEMPPNVYGYIYEGGMIRLPTDDQLAKDEADANKPSRAEILAKARAAKKAKADATEEPTEQPTEVE